MKRMEIWYFETSAINWLEDNLTAQDAIATKAFQNVRGREWVISPVCMWEILLTGDELLRDKLIFSSQLLFDSEMLPSPEEILIDFINKGFPKKETARLSPGSCEVCNTWRNISGKTDRTFVIDREKLTALTKELRKINKLLDKVLRDKDVPIFGEGDEPAVKDSLEAAYNKLEFDGKERASPENTRIYKVALFYILMLLCAGIGLNRRIIDEYWAQYGLNGLNERFDYALGNFQPLVYRGPLALLAMMTVSQAKTKPSRGVYFDSLHAMYSAYSHRFFTADSHFVELREMIGEHPISNKIQHIDEVELQYHDRENPSNGARVIT